MSLFSNLVSSITAQTYIFGQLIKQIRWFLLIFCKSHFLPLPLLGFNLGFQIRREPILTLYHGQSLFRCSNVRSHCILHYIFMNILLKLTFSYHQSTFLFHRISFCLKCVFCILNVAFQIFIELLDFHFLFFTVIELLATDKATFQICILESFFFWTFDMLMNYVILFFQRSK